MTEVYINLYVIGTAILRHATYQKKESTPLYLVHEAAEETAHGASCMDLCSSGGKELKCHGILH
jgi:hypothetical protein